MRSSDVSSQASVVGRQKLEPLYIWYVIISGIFYHRLITVEQDELSQIAQSLLGSLSSHSLPEVVRASLPDLPPDGVIKIIQVIAIYK